MTDDRALVFARIREALQTPHPFHGQHTERSSLAPMANGKGYAAWLPRVEDTPSGRLDAFRERSALLKTELVVTTRAGLAAAVQRQRDRHAWESAAWHRTELTQRAAEAAGLPLLSTDQAYETAALERVDVSFTGCDALVAQTGSILLTTRSGGGWVLSILPPHHVVLADASQLIADFPASMSLLRERYGQDLLSMICLETDPSRTGDIERILVLGALGPKKLSVVLVE